jgi:hypothetical protein
MTVVQNNILQESMQVDSEPDIQGETRLQLLVLEFSELYFLLETLTHGRLNMGMNNRNVT